MRPHWARTWSWWGTATAEGRDDACRTKRNARDSGSLRPNADLPIGTRDYHPVNNASAFYDISVTTKR